MEAALKKEKKRNTNLRTHHVTTKNSYFTPTLVRWLCVEFAPECVSMDFYWSLQKYIEHTCSNGIKHARFAFKSRFVPFKTSDQ